MKKRLFYNNGTSVWIEDDEEQVITSLLLAHYTGTEKYDGEWVATYTEGPPVRFVTRPG